VTVAGLFRGAADAFGQAVSSAGGSDLVVARLDPAGTRRWVRTAGGATDDAAAAVAVAANGDVVATGNFSGTVDFGTGAFTAAGGGDLFVVRLAPAGGATVWARRHGGLGYQFGTAAALRADGSIALGAFVQQTIDFGNGPRTSAGSWDAAVAVVAG
jgi:hypothetical protein